MEEMATKSKVPARENKGLRIANEDLTKKSEDLTKKTEDLTKTVSDLRTELSTVRNIIEMMVSGHISMPLQPSSQLPSTSEPKSNKGKSNMKILKCLYNECDLE